MINFFWQHSVLCDGYLREVFWFFFHELQSLLSLLFFFFSSKIHAKNQWKFLYLLIRLRLRFWKFIWILNMSCTLRNISGVASTFIPYETVPLLWSWMALKILSVQRQMIHNKITKTDNIHEPFFYLKFDFGKLWHNTVLSHFPTFQLILKFPRNSHYAHI